MKLLIDGRIISKNDLFGLVFETVGTVGEGIGAYIKLIKEISISRFRFFVEF